MDKILIDTSVWIEFFRKKEPFYSRVSKLIDDDSVCCTGVILAELIQGVKQGLDISVLRDFLYVFHFLEESRELWAEAGKLSFTLRKGSKQVGLIDCYIALAAYNEKAAILTLDSRFTEIKKHLEIVLVSY
ncbi:MAG: PIN domain-containing protein [Dehalococcoidales bacterium]|nr:PIN domain-containing protein [Dehalococcoidales bacterium]